MATNHNQMAASQSRGRGEATGAKSRNYSWEDIKSDALRIYIQENKSLNTTRAEIATMYGFERCERAWKKMLKVWDVKKNLSKKDMRFIVAKAERSALDEGKHMEFFYGGTRITTERIEKFKSRETGGVPTPAETPPSITYNNPPDLNSKIHPLEVTHKESMDHSSLSQISGFSVAQATQVQPLDYRDKNLLTTNCHLAQIPLISMLNRYLYDEPQHWSVYHLRHQLGDHDNVVAKHIQRIKRLIPFTEELNSLDRDISDEEQSRPGLCCVGGQFYVESCSTIDYEQRETSEDAASEKLLDLTSRLAEFQQKYGEFDERTVVEEFKLAISLQHNDYLEEAEYHLRRVLNEHKRPTVLSILGMILAKTSRLEESILLLFSAFCHFIVDFSSCSIEYNSLIFIWIKYHFNELVLKSELDWTALILCMEQMTVTIQKATSEGTTSKTFSELLIHGFSFAHEWSVLGKVDPAMDLYRVLFQHSSHLNAADYGIEKAIAHQKYGLLLRTKGRWISSGEQLVLACESAINSGTHNRQLTALLGRSYNNLRPHLTDVLDEGISLAEKLRRMITQIQLQNFLYPQDSSKAVQLSRIDEYFSSDLPVLFSTLQTSDDWDDGQLVLSSIPNNRAHANSDGILTSSRSWSSNEEHRCGVTYPSSGITELLDASA